MWKFLMPYFSLVLFYILATGLYGSDPQTKTIRSALLKCLPIFYLIFLVSKAHVVSSDHSNLKTFVLAGLVASVCGDFFLNWMKAMFVPGVMCFGGAHMLYTMAFGLQPYAWNVGAVFAFFFLMITIYISTGIKTRQDAVFDLKPMIQAYIFIIHVMGWRSYVYYDNHPNQKGAVLVFAGALTFMLSDFILALSMFKVKFSRSFLCIMSIYYIGQFLIAMSVVVPSKAVYKPPVQFFGV